MAETFTYEEAVGSDEFSYEDAVGFRDTRPDKAFARGIVNSPARLIQGIGAMGGSRGQLISQIGDDVAGQTEPLANRIAPRGVGALPEFSERMGEQTPSVLGGAVLGGVTGGPMAAFGETALGIGVPVVGESMRAMGAGDDEIGRAHV